jgi:hypothetical protein
MFVVHLFEKKPEKKAMCPPMNGKKREEAEIK